MSVVLKLNMALPDGRVVMYHAPVEVIIEVTTGAVQMVVESWADANAAKRRASSDARHVIQLPSIEPNGEWRQKKMDALVAAWGGTLVDLDPPFDHGFSNLMEYAEHLGTTELVSEEI